MKWMLASLLVISGASVSAGTIAFGLEGAEVRDAAPRVFEGEGIWFRKLDDGRFEFRTEDVARVQLVAAEIREAIIPFGRSVSYGPEMERAMLKRLNASAVPFEIRRFDGANWFVWGTSHTENFKRLEQAAAKEVGEELLKETHE